MNYILLYVGTAMIVVGLLVLIHEKTPSNNEFSIFGASFKLSHPSLVVIALGVVLIFRGSDEGYAKPGKSDVMPPPAAVAPTEVILPPAPDAAAADNVPAVPEPAVPKPAVPEPAAPEPVQPDLRSPRANDLDWSTPRS